MIHLVTNPIGVMALAKREIHRFFSVANQTIFPPLVSSALFMYIFGIAIGSRVNFSATGLTYLQFITPGLMAMHLITSSYENTSSSLFIGRWHNHIQEILLAPLSYIEMVLGLLAGGVARGILICIGVWLVSLLFTPSTIAHPLALLYFMLLISVIFSCAGMMGALWNTYLIVPMALLGGVFHPLFMLPSALQILSHFNPIYYMISGIRYSMTNTTDTPVITCAIVTLVIAATIFSATVYLFKIGYKLRT